MMPDFFRFGILIFFVLMVGWCVPDSADPDFLVCTFFIFCLVFLLSVRSMRDDPLSSSLGNLNIVVLVERGDRAANVPRLMLLVL